MIDDREPMIAGGRWPPRELFGVHSSRRTPRWVPWTCGALVASGVAVLLLGPGGDDLTHELAWRVPLQLGLVGLVSLVVGRAAGRITTIDETGVRCTSGVRTDAVRWEELADVRVSGGGAVLRAVDGRTVRVAPLPRDVAEALRTAVRGGGTA